MISLPELKSIIVFLVNMSDKNKTRKALIIGAGSIENPDKYEEIISGFDFIITADGGYDNSLTLNLKSDLLIGDFDSIDKDTMRNLPKDLKIIKYPFEKDMSDLEIALDYLVENSFTEAMVIGGTGSRLDHSISNILTIFKYSSRNLEITIVNDKNIISRIKSRMYFEKDNYYYSLIPVSVEGIVVSLNGFYYDLTKQTIEFGSTLGVSNYITKEHSTIELHSGVGLLIKSID